MKRLSMFLLTVLLIASLFVSCDTNTNAVLDEHVTVSFSTGSDGRSLGYEIENITNLKWHYSANKTNDNDHFKFGATEGATLENFETQIELSQGKWDFTLWANKVVDESGTEGAKVYEGSVTGVLITKENSPQRIVIDVSPNLETVKGSILFDGVEVSLKNTNEGTTVYAKTATIEGVAGGEIVLTNGTATKADLTPGDYVVTVKYSETIDGTTVVFASETIVVTVWSGRTTTISGNVSEETGSAIIDGNVQVPTQATVTKTAASGQTTVFTANVAPANNGESSKMESTTAVFEADALDNNASYSLSVAVTNDVENGNINIGSTSGIAATLNLSLKNGATDVSTFNGKTVTITTYIAKGLGNNNVSVTGPSEANISGVSYDSDTGKLVFTTNHFSEYKVKVNGNASYEAYNATSKKVYEKIYSSDGNVVNAISEANSKDTILVLKNIILSEKIQITKSITIDGQSFSISCGNNVDRVIDMQNITDNIRLVINDLNIVGPTSGTYTRGLSAYKNTGNLYIELNNCKVSASYYALNIASENVKVKLVANNCTAIGGWCAVQTHSPDTECIFNNCELIGLNDKTYNDVGWNDFGTVVINELAENARFTFNNSTIKAKETEGNIQTAFDIRGKNANIAMNDSSILLEGDNAYSYVDKGENNTVSKNNDSVSLHIADMEQITINTDNVTFNETTAAGNLIISYKGTDYSFDLADCPNDGWQVDQGRLSGRDYYCKVDLEEEMLCFDFDVSITAYPDTKYELYLTEFIK